jgi:uncharacterized membrane protein YvlD (DUF360 family)
VKLLLGILGRYVLVWAINVLALLLAASILPGFYFDTSNPHWWVFALTVPIEFALLLILLRPLLLLLTLPLNTLTLGLPTLLFNGLILYLAGQMDSSFVINSFGDALVGLVVLTAITTSIVGWLGIDEAYPFFQSVIYRLGRRYGPPRRKEITRGLLMIQLDGLSFSSLQRALERGRMPMVTGLLARVSHRLYRWHCGLPSNTPAVQAGLFYGSRVEAPGYRWYDRAARKLRVASHPPDLRQLEDRAAAAGGEPLLAGGSCINSFMSGGAAKRLLTLSAQQQPPSERRQGELADFNLFWLSPYAYTKALLAAFWDLGTAVFWGLLGRLRKRRVRLGVSLRRLATRAVANAFLRETAYFWIKQDLVRGAPVIYTNFVGYDEVAHYSGPDTYEAQITLAAVDRKLRRLERMIRGGMPITYDLMLLSDHGQTPSIPFRHRFGRSLEEMLAELAGGISTPTEVPPLETMHVTTLLEELRESHAGELARVAARSRRTLERLSGAGKESREPGDKAPELMVCVSGCLAHVYASGSDWPLNLEGIRLRYPGFLERLVSHPGIGFVVARREGGGAVVLGGHGLRDLDTGEIRGEVDPLAPYPDPDRWAAELRRLVSYQSSGDLVLNGRLLPGGEVVVFEDQLSSHGGLGGPQTEPFVILPAYWATTPQDLQSPESLYAHILAALRSQRLKRPA